MRRLVLILLLGCVAASSSGCIWLAIPGLAYSGYQLTQKKDSGTDSDSGKPQAKAASPGGAASGAPNDDNFE